MDIAKFGVKLSNVFDPRLVVNEPVYRVFRGANDISIEKVVPNANSATQLQFIYNSSPSYFLDRHFITTGSFVLQVKLVLNPTSSSVTVSTGPLNVLIWGSSVATCAFPFHELATSASIEVNNCKTDINYQQYKNLLLRLTSTQNNMKVRGCPSYLDTTVQYNDCYLARNNPLSGYNDSDPLSGAIGNGSFDNFTFMMLSGGGLTPAVPGTSQIAIVGTGGSGTSYIEFNANGQWVIDGSGSGITLNAGAYVTLYVQIDYREPCLTPLSVFDDAREYMCEGLHNVQTLQMLYTINSGENRVLRQCPKACPIPVNSGAATVFPSIQSCMLYNNVPATFAGAQLQITKLTPPINTAAYEIPRVALIPSCKFEMLTGSMVSTLGAYPGTQNNPSSTQLLTSSVAISGIPDFMIIFARPQAYTNIASAPLSEADWFCPISNLQIEWQGATSLLNTFTPSDLYDLSVRNGLQQPYLESLGFANKLEPAVTDGVITVSNAIVPLVGAPIVLRPCYDWGSSLPSAPGLGGSFTMRVAATVNNYISFPVNNVYLYCACVYGGYLVTDGPNSSAFFKTVLTYRDLESVAQNAPSVSMDTLSRFVGGGMHERMSHTIARPRHIHHHGHHERSASVPAAEHKKRLA